MANDFQSELRSFNKRLEILDANLQIMKKCGVDEDLLIAYMCHKLKLSEKKAKDILFNIEEFYRKLMVGGMAKNIARNAPYEEDKK